MFPGTQPRFSVCAVVFARILSEMADTLTFHPVLLQITANKRRLTTFQPQDLLEDESSYAFVEVSHFFSIQSELFSREVRSIHSDLLVANMAANSPVITMHRVITITQFFFRKIPIKYKKCLPRTIIFSEK